MAVRIVPEDDMVIKVMRANHARVLCFIQLSRVFQIIVRISKFKRWCKLKISIFTNCMHSIC